jgi:uncharacterized protein
MYQNRAWVNKLLIVGLALVALTGCLPVRSVSSAQTGSPTVQTAVQAMVERTITVVGIGKVSLVPDIARLDVGANDSAATVAEAKGKVDAQIAAIIAALTASGVADKDIQTSNYSIYYEQPQVLPEAQGTSAGKPGVYHVTNMLLVTVRDVAKAGDVLDAAVNAGANQVYGVTFTVSDESRWESQAREKAVADATARAQELARLSGLQMGQVLTISEVIGGAAPVVMSSSAVGRGGGSDIVPGEQELSMQLQVTFGVQ